MCYLEADEDIKYSTYPNIQVNGSYLNKIDETHFDETRNSLLFALFDKQFENMEIIGQTNISFGLTGDKFYTENNYTKW